MPESLLLAVILAAAFAAGIMNSVAGGGTLLTFPALITFLAARYGDSTEAVANATSTLALLPGSLAGAWAYRNEYREARPFALKLLPPSLVGGIVGSVLVAVSPKAFGPLVPWLILTAAVLFLLQQPLGAMLKKRSASAISAPVGTGRTAVLIGFQFLIAVYGGYFGAGIGILMLTALGFMGLSNIHHANAVKTLLASVINGVSVVVFVAGGLIDWPAAACMSAAAVIGGYVGARVARTLPGNYVRWVVIVIGFTLAGYYLWKQLGGKP
ncbi:MAG: sulfite exporter TauE/SafE family protein [Fimbriiglobus sp.]|jgi:hypothetical protein|nr:sulfite exporter TauE/SafE family protein [Fimbriiglobus sp.]